MINTHNIHIQTNTSNIREYLIHILYVYNTNTSNIREYLIHHLTEGNIALTFC